MLTQLACKGSTCRGNSISSTEFGFAHQLRWRSSPYSQTLTCLFISIRCVCYRISKFFTKNHSFAIVSAPCHKAHEQCSEHYRTVQELLLSQIHGIDRHLPLCDHGIYMLQLRSHGIYTLQRSRHYGRKQGTKICSRGVAKVLVWVSVLDWIQVAEHRREGCR